MNPFEKKYSITKQENPENMSIKGLYHLLAKKIGTDKIENHELATRLNRAKEEAENGDRSKLEELYHKLTGKKGDKIDLEV